MLEHSVITDFIKDAVLEHAPEGIKFLTELFKSDD